MAWFRENSSIDPAVLFTSGIYIFVLSLSVSFSCLCHFASVSVQLLVLSSQKSLIEKIQKRKLPPCEFEVNNKTCRQVRDSSSSPTYGVILTSAWKNPITIKEATKLSSAHDRISLPGTSLCLRLCHNVCLCSKVLTPWPKKKNTFLRLRQILHLHISSQACVCVWGWVLLPLWEHKSVYKVTLWGLVLLTGTKHKSVPVT